MEKYELINGFPQILNILHQVDRSICEPLCDLAVRQDAHKLKNCFVFAWGKKLQQGGE